MQRTRETDRWLCQNADAVIVCSEGLFHSKKNLVEEDRLFLVPNGVDIDHYSQCCQRGDDAKRGNASDTALEGGSANSTGSPREYVPVFGYTGTIHNQRLDVELVEQLARRLKTGILRFIGPEMLPSQDRNRLIETGRVEFVGQKPYDELPHWMSQMDVMIVPHQVTAFTESLNPLKLWEYLAAGIPIVSTPVAGFRDYPDLIHLAADADSFFSKMQDALKEDSSGIARRRAAATGNSWKARIDSINQIIQFAIANRKMAASS
jgi:glycosyltransferase involved in cell wall biosynthesis